MPKKNPHAVKLGRLGGRASSAAKVAANKRNARMGRTDATRGKLIPRRQARLKFPAHTDGCRRRKTPQGTYQYQIAPGRWVSRERMRQLRNKGLTAN